MKTTGAAPAVDAVQDVSFSVEAGKTLGIVGESGSGKSQTAMPIMGLLPSNALATVFRSICDAAKAWGSSGNRGAESRRWRGRETVRGQDRAAGEMRHLRREVQMIFLDPLASLDPRMTIDRIVAEPIAVPACACCVPPLEARGNGRSLVACIRAGGADSTNFPIP